jgi:hypothetical protein
LFESHVDDLELGRSQPVLRMFDRYDRQVVLFDEFDLRCLLQPQPRAQLTGFDRPGVLVTASPLREASCSVRSAEDVSDLLQRHRDSNAQGDFVAAFCQHTRPSWEMDMDSAAEVIRKTLTPFDGVRLQTPCDPGQRLVKAPLHVAKAGEAALLAMRLGGVELGQDSGQMPRLEPDWLWDELDD